jgi:hypothetical protein
MKVRVIADVIRDEEFQLDVHEYKSTEMIEMQTCDITANYTNELLPLSSIRYADDPNPYARLLANDGVTRIAFALVHSLEKLFRACDKLMVRDDMYPSIQRSAFRFRTEDRYVSETIGWDPSRNRTRRFATIS